MSFLKGFNGGFNSSFINTSTNAVPNGFTWKPATFTWGFDSGYTPSFKPSTIQSSFKTSNTWDDDGNWNDSSDWSE